MFTRISMRVKDHQSRGQSLVETALFLPLIIFLLAGVLEISNLLVTQNRVSTAARSGTRFAAANFHDEQWAAWESTYATEVANVAQNNVTETLDLDPARWDIWAIKATITNSGGNYSFTEWRPVHVNDGIIGTVMSLTDWTAREPALQGEILAALDENIPSGGSMEIVATDAYHHRHAFLGLLPYDLGEFTRIRGLTVMRVDDAGATYGACDTFPIALSLYNKALYPADYQPDPDNGELQEFLDGEREWYPFFDADADPPINLHPDYPYENDWPYGGQDYHWPLKPTNANANTFPPPYYTVADNTEYPYNLSGRNLRQAQVGDIFMIKQEDENVPSAFGWLRWDMTTSGNSAPVLGTSLEWPGNSDSYYYPPWSDDGQINRFDLLKVSTGSVVSAKDEMRVHVDEGVRGRLVRLLVFTPPDWEEPRPDGSGTYPPGDANGDTYKTTMSSGVDNTYEVYGFVLGRIVAWELSGSDNWLILEFHGWDVECVPGADAYP